MTKLPGTILIVDDEPTNLRVLFDSLKTAGHRVLIADNGQSALQCLTLVKPDLVLLDILLPDLNGYQVYEQMQQDEQLADIPIIFITALSDPVDRVSGLRLNACDYITKPFFVDEVLARVEKHLTMRQFQQHLQRKNTVLEQELIERNASEEALRSYQTSLKSQYRFLYTIINSLSNPFYVVNVTDYSIEVANTAAQALGNTTTHTCYELTHHRITPCDDLEHPCPLRQVCETKKAMTVEHIHYDAQGNPRIMEVHGYPIFDDEGNVVQMIEYSIDITERKQVEQKLHKLTRAVEQSGSTIVITNTDGAIEFVNPAFTLITGYSFEEAVGQNPKILKSGYQPDAVYAELWRTITQGIVWQGELLNRKKSGELYWEHATIAPVKNNVGEVTHYVAVKDDITKRKEAEEELQIAYESLEARIDELSTLNLIMQMLGRASDAVKVLPSVATSLNQLVMADETLIVLMDEQSTYFEVVAHYSSNQTLASLTHQQYHRDELIEIVKLIESSQSPTVVDLVHPPSTCVYQKTLQNREVAVLIHLPLFSRGHVVGFISLGRYSGEEPFILAEIRLAETVAGQVASVVENERLFAQERAAKQRMQEELTLAREIQQGLLKPAQPNWSHLKLICDTHSAREIGGDFYTYHAFPLPRLSGHRSRRYAIAVGDISGKGASAALLMATSLTQFDAVMVGPLSPEERLISLDSALKPYLAPRRQNCALCYLEFEVLSDSYSAELIVLNAAGVPPYIKRKNGQVELVDAGGFALGLGLGKEVGYHRQQISLGKGDMVILVSDGVVEAMTNQGELLGFDRLSQLIESATATTVESMLSQLTDSIHRFIGSAEPHDDTTIVVAQL